MCFFFFKQKTAYEMRISDWSSDVCSSDLAGDDGSDPRHYAAASLKPFPLSTSARLRRCDPRHYAAASLKPDRRGHMHGRVLRDPRHYAAASLKPRMRRAAWPARRSDPRHYAAASLKHVDHWASDRKSTRLKSSH